MGSWQFQKCKNRFCAPNHSRDTMFQSLLLEKLDFGKTSIAVKQAVWESTKNIFYNPETDAPI